MLEKINSKDMKMKFKSIFLSLEENTGTDCVIYYDGNGHIIYKEGELSAYEVRITFKREIESNYVLRCNVFIFNNELYKHLLHTNSYKIDISNVNCKKILRSCKIPNINDICLETYLRLSMESPSEPYECDICTETRHEFFHNPVMPCCKNVSSKICYVCFIKQTKYLDWRCPLCRFKKQVNIYEDDDFY